MTGPSINTRDTIEIDLFEHMFEYCCMNASATVRSLQQRITQMQPLRLDDRALPTPTALRPLLPGGALRKGSSYTVHGSQQLALALLAAASAAGSWCGVVGIPTFGAEAAAELGIALDRCVLIPDPGTDALGLAGALSEVLTVVLLRTPAQPGPGDAERISARLREHGSALVVAGEWPHPESTLSVVGSRWSGLGRGEGTLMDRELTVESQDRRGVHRHLVHFRNGVLATPATSARTAESARHASPLTAVSAIPAAAAVSTTPAISRIARSSPPPMALVTELHSGSMA